MKEEKEIRQLRVEVSTILNIIIVLTPRHKEAIDSFKVLHNTLSWVLNENQEYKDDVTKECKELIK